MYIYTHIYKVSTAVQALPACIPFLLALRTLSLSNNNLRSLPAGVVNLVNLESLKVLFSSLLLPSLELSDTQVYEP